MKTEKRKLSVRTFQSSGFADEHGSQRRATFNVEANATNLDVLARMRANLQARQYIVKPIVPKSYEMHDEKWYRTNFSATEDQRNCEISARPGTTRPRGTSRSKTATSDSAKKRTKGKRQRSSVASVRAASQSRSVHAYAGDHHRDIHADTSVQEQRSSSCDSSEYTDSDSSPPPQKREVPSFKYKTKVSEHSMPHENFAENEKEATEIYGRTGRNTTVSAPIRDGEYRTADGRSVADFGVQSNTGVPEHVLALAELLRYQTQVKHTGSRFSLIPSLNNSINKQDSRQGSPKKSALMTLNQAVTDDPLNLRFPKLPIDNNDQHIDSSVPMVLARPEEMKISGLGSSQTRGAVHRNPVFEDLRADPDLNKIYAIFQQDNYFVNLSFDLLYSTDAWRAGFNHLKEVIYRDIYEERAATLQEMQVAQNLIQGYEETTETLNRENERLAEQLRTATEEAEKVLGMHGMLDFDLKKVMEEKSTLEAQNKELQVKISEMEREFAELLVVKNNLNEEIKRLHVEATQKEQRINKSVEKAREFKEQLDTYTREGQVEKMRGMINSLSDQIAERSAQLREKVEIIEKLEKRVSKLTTMNQAMATEREQFIYRLEVSMMTTEDKLSTLVRLRERVRKLKEEKSRVSTELKETSAKLEKMQEIGKSLKATLKTREGELKEFKVDYNRMKEEYERIVADFNYKEARISNLEQQLDLYKKELANSQQEMKANAEMLQSVTVNSLDNQQRIVTLAALNDRVEQLESDKLELKNTIAELKEELAAARKENSELVATKEQLASQVAVSNEKITHYELLYASQKKMLEDTEQQRLDLHNKYLETQSTIAKLQLDYETSSLKQGSLEAENAKLIKSSDTLAEELEYLRKENENLRQDKGTDGDALHRLKLEFENLAAKHTTQTQDLEDKQLRIQELIFQNDRMMKFIEEVKDNYRGDNVVSLINENLRLKADLDNIMSIGKNKLEKTISLISENNDMKEAVSKLHVDAATKDAHLGRAYHENETLSRKLLLLTKDNRDLRDKLAFLENKAKSNDYKIETLKLELEKRNRLLAARELEVSKLRAMCVKLTQE